MKLEFLVDCQLDGCSLFALVYTYFIAIYLHSANITVNDIDIVCRICVKCIWKSKYTAQGYLKSMRPREQILESQIHCHRPKAAN